MDTGKLSQVLADRVDGEVRFDPGTRGAYAHDGSNYRQPPLGVVVPRSADAAAAAISVCAEFGAPVLSRGGGTSLAGQCCNTAVVIDWTKYCHQVVSVNPGGRTAIVQPGAALDKVNDAVRKYGLMVGPKPSTHVSCTIGGMIGNNSCGATAQAYGKMADSVRRLEIACYDGLRTWTGPTSDAEYQQIIAAGGTKAALFQRLREIRDTYLGPIRTGYPRIPRRVSGYNLDELLPEKGFHVARALVGSESTLATVLRAEIGLVDVPRCRSLVVLGYPDIADAADIVPLVIRHEPLAVEGLDDTLISLEREEHLAGEAIDKLPAGAGWLMIQFGGASKEEVEAKAHTLIGQVRSGGGSAGHPRPHVAYLEDPAVEDELWHVREAGLGATAYPPGKRETHEGWEDAAVPPERLGSYLRDFRDLLRRYDYGGAALYRHFGHGCVHTRIPFELRTAEGVAAYRSFVTDAAVLVVSYGGSLSGEHGDGQSRGELLPVMFGPELMRAFGELKAAFDPGNRMNPGKVVQPDRLDQNLTLRGWSPREPTTFFSYPADGGKFSAAASRCVGVGKCRGDEGGVMCPSYRVTRDEQHATRGRARPGSHYPRGWLPAAARLAALAPRLVNGAAHAPGLAQLIKRLGGIDSRRALPRFAPERFTRWYARAAGPATGERILLWPDTFTNSFHPEVARAAVAVLNDAGYAVEVPGGALCCGLTWISTGQLGVARRVLDRTITALRPALHEELRVVVLEPSCAAVFRSDAAELLGSDDARLLARQTKTLAEVLGEAGWRPPGRPASPAAPTTSATPAAPTASATPATSA